MNPFFNIVIVFFEAIATVALFVYLGNKNPLLRVLCGTIVALSTLLASIVVLFRIMSTGI